MEYDSRVLDGFASAGMVAGLVLLVSGLIMSSTIASASQRGFDPRWLISGFLSFGAALFFSFPMSNRDHPLTWFFMQVFIYGGGVGIGLVLAAVAARQDG